jgi:hypothetical protein
MTIDTRIRKLGSNRWVRRYTELVVRRVLGRLSRRIRRVRVHVFDVNGPRGGIDKLCRLVVETHGRRPLVINHADASVRGAVRQAARRAAGRLRRGFA